MEWSTSCWNANSKEILVVLTTNKTILTTKNHFNGEFPHAEYFFQQFTTKASYAVYITWTRITLNIKNTLGILQTVHSFSFDSVSTRMSIVSVF